MANKEITKKPAKQKKESKGGAKKFFREFFGEVKKLTWSTPKELAQNTLTVIVFVAIFAVIIGVLDIAFSAGFQFLANLKG